MHMHFWLKSYSDYTFFNTYCNVLVTCNENIYYQIEFKVLYSLRIGKQAVFDHQKLTQIFVFSLNYLYLVC